MESNQAQHSPPFQVQNPLKGDKARGSDFKRFFQWGNSRWLTSPVISGPDARKQKQNPKQKKAHGAVGTNKSAGKTANKPAPNVVS